MTTDLALAYLTHGMENIAGQIAPRSRRIYEHDALAFAQWLASQDIGLEQIDYTVISAWRMHLQASYAPATAKRMWSVTRRILDEQVRAKRIASNPAKEMHGFKAEDESPHIALTLQEARTMLDAIDASTAMGKRDYAILSVLLYTGIRRFECSCLTIGDMSMAQGHHILTIQGKGGRREIVKLRVEAWRAIMDYLEATGRAQAKGDAPLFVQFRKGDRPIEAAISPSVIYRLVCDVAKRLNIPALKPHGLRATFVTLAIEVGATLEQAQYAARHKDPRTTERYRRRKLNLDNNAVDKIQIY